MANDRITIIDSGGKVVTLSMGQINDGQYVQRAGPLLQGGGVAFPAGSAYTASNGTTDRTFDANSTSIDELADVIATLIADLKAAGVLT
jgi:hypothetical protein